MDAKCAVALLLLATCTCAQNEAEVDICLDIWNGNGDKYDITQINDCARNSHSSSSAANLRIACPDLPCLKENNCKFGYQRDLQGCWTCQCDENGDENFYQSDIVLSESLKRLLSGGNNKNSRTRARRGAGRGIPLWTNYPSGDNYIIPYTIDNSIGTQGRQAIQAAVADFESQTCLRLLPRTNEQYYINFYNGGGCFSPVGLQDARQGVSLGNGCWFKGTVIHEVMHSLGFWHEQSRPDRDSFIRVIYGNIQSGMSYNFDKMTTNQINSRGSNYDIGSVMHYGSTAFSSNGRPTITDLRGQPVRTQRNGFSQSDINQLNEMYGCKVGTGGGTGGGDCSDLNSKCSGWASRGECKNNPGYMLKNCCKSCKAVETGTGDGCSDGNDNCAIWASAGECANNPGYMLKSCCKSCKAVEDCDDANNFCSMWAKVYCDSAIYGGYMRKNCKKSCKFC